NITLTGYLFEHREISVESDPIDLPAITLRQRTAPLMISTQPEGANILINGQLQQQQTPPSITLLPGTYVVTLEKDGRVETQKVEMLDQMVFLRIPLNP